MWFSGLTNMRLCHLTVVLAAVAGALGRLVPCGEHATLIDSSKHFCCNGASFGRRPNLDCCENLHGQGETFWTDASICCGDKVHPKNGRNLGCCDGQTFDQVANVCCSGTLHPRDSNDMRCCGNKYINRTENLCCVDPLNKSQVNYVKREQDADMRCCGAVPYDRKLRKCSPYKKIISKYEGECGRNKIYQLKTSFCCAGKIHNVPTILPNTDKEVNKELGCCYTEVYNKNQHKCCAFGTTARLVPKNGVGCCILGEPGYYNLTSEVCCNGYPQPRSWTNTACCNGRSYDALKHGCCGGKDLYDRSSQQCCEGGTKSSVVAKTEGTQCCGGSWLERDQICCDERLPLKKQQVDHNACCMKRSRTPVTYNKGNQMCVRGELLPNRNTGTLTLRCNGVVYENVTESEKCCGNGVYKYNEDTQTCCYNTVHNISTNAASCCRGKAYDMHDKNNPCLEFDSCGGKTFVVGMETCCGNKLYRGLRRCCGNRIYRPASQRCCGGEMVVDRRKGRCCGIFPYQRKFELCDERRKMPVPREMLTSSDYLCRRKHQNNTYSTMLAGCALPTVVRGIPRRILRRRGGLELIVSSVGRLPLQLPSSSGKPVARTLRVQLPTGSLRCRRKHLPRRVIIMLRDPITSNRVDLGTVPHHIVPYSRKLARDLRRNLTPTWCQAVCEKLRDNPQKNFTFSRCYRSFPGR